MTTTQSRTPAFGTLIRSWRQRRRLSQLDLALGAQVSPRHVSFLETGRSVPSRAMILRLAAVLEVPPREQNRLLVAAGLAPEYQERNLDAAELAPIRDGIDRVLAAYQPYPCVVVDPGWNIVRANPSSSVLLEGVAPALLERPNALRIALHPDGLAPRITNLAQWRHHLVERLHRQVAAGGSTALSELLTELETYPGAPADPAAQTDDLGGIAVPLQLRTVDGVPMSLISTVTTFGTALDLTVAELSIEAFLPTDTATAAVLTRRAQES